MDTTQLPSKTQYAGAQAALREALCERGALQALADALGVRYQAVQRYLRQGVVPAERVLDVADWTGIPACELRPDLYPIERVTVRSPAEPAHAAAAEQPGAPAA